MRLADLPKGRFEADDDALDKAQAMLRQGKPAAFVSDYLGMDAKQVAEIDDSLGESRDEAPPTGPPCADDDERAAARRDAIRGSRALGKAIARLLAKRA